MWNTFSVHLGYIFRSNLSFWVQLPPSGEVLGGRGPKGSRNPWLWGPLGFPLGSHSHENSPPFLMKKLVEFVADLCMHIDSHNGSKCVPKWSQYGIKIHFFCRRFHTAFSLAFGKLFHNFPTWPTFDSTAVYTTFVGSGLFCKVQTCSQNDHQQWCQMAPKTIPKPTKLQSRNEAQQ